MCRGNVGKGRWFLNLTSHLMSEPMCQAIIVTRDKIFTRISKIHRHCCSPALPFRSHEHCTHRVKPQLVPKATMPASMLRTQLRRSNATLRVGPRPVFSPRSGYRQVHSSRYRLAEHGRSLQGDYDAWKNTAAKHAAEMDRLAHLVQQRLGPQSTAAKHAAEIDRLAHVQERLHGSSFSQKPRNVRCFSRVREEIPCLSPSGTLSAIKSSKKGTTRINESTKSVLVSNQVGKNQSWQKLIDVLVGEEEMGRSIVRDALRSLPGRLLVVPYDELEWLPDYHWQRMLTHVGAPPMPSAVLPKSFKVKHMQVRARPIQFRSPTSILPAKPELKQNLNPNPMSFLQGG
eukprot:CAMPEP_0174733502 /NCGR_PEP_ID=MMETSP1094-20130205/61437_1 /TAXON_ID=156173 /ORGANISM="Chrysochromulina brevifilum, Strain UTEX LB 985" /LENGTH=343 /DNA_ID=CAMNT_0015936165 /DNA_START=456 /DNA_END=1488 /DNA_ORIENTATION=-